MTEKYGYNYEIRNGHGFGEIVDRGWIIAKTQAELRATAIRLMSKTEEQTMRVGKAKSLSYSGTAIDIYNHYFDNVGSDMGEWWDKNGMHAFDKATGKALGRTSR